MLLSILTLAIILGLLFRSFKVFLFGLIGLLFIRYPMATMLLLVIAGVVAFFLNKGDNHEPSKLNPLGGRDDEPS